MMKPKNLQILSAFVLVIAVITLGTVFSEKDVEERYEADAGLTDPGETEIPAGPSGGKKDCDKIVHQCNWDCASEEGTTDQECANRCRNVRETCENPPQEENPPEDEDGGIWGWIKDLF